jgi:hypothetical protein
VAVTSTDPTTGALTTTVVPQNVTNVNGSSASSSGPTLAGLGTINSTAAQILAGQNGWSCPTGNVASSTPWGWAAAAGTSTPSVGSSAVTPTASSSASNATTTTEGMLSNSDHNFSRILAGY